MFWLMPNTQDPIYDTSDITLLLFDPPVSIGEPFACIIIPPCRIIMTGYVEVWPAYPILPYIVNNACHKSVFNNAVHFDLTTRISGSESLVPISHIRQAYMYP